MIEVMEKALKTDLFDILKVSGVLGAVKAVELASIALLFEIIVKGCGIVYILFKLYKLAIEHRWDREDRENDD